MIFSPHDSPFILVFTADARSVGNSQLSCCLLHIFRGHCGHDILVGVWPPQATPIYALICSLLHEYLFIGKCVHVDVYISPVHCVRCQAKDDVDDHDVEHRVHLFFIIADPRAAAVLSV